MSGKSLSVAVKAGAVGAALFVLSTRVDAWEIDPLLTTREVATSAAAGFASDTATPCVFGTIPDTLSLHEAVERTLCANPKTREAWANVKISAAEVGIARSAYLPTISGSWQGVRDDTRTNVIGHPEYSANYRNSVLRTESLSLNWVLYDFGGRSAALSNARALFEAAVATQEATLQTAFGTVAKDFYAAQAAQGAFAAAKEVEATAAQSLEVARKRVSHGVAPISDELQAKTSWAEAVTNRTKAFGESETARGTLASDMGVLPDARFALPDVGDGVRPDGEFSEGISQLIEEAESNHPSILAARARMDAASYKADQTRAEGLPSLNFVAKYSWNNNPTTLEIGVPQFPTHGREWYLGFQVNIPIFEGFSRIYKVREANAQTELQRFTLGEAKQQVALDVWSSYQSLRTSTDTLADTSTLLEVANESYKVAQKRYEMGVGTILELLNAQSSLATAKRERIRSLTEWRSSRLQLASKLGRLHLADANGSQ